MNPRIKLCSVVIFLLLIFLYAGTNEFSGISSKNPLRSFHKVRSETHSRKLMGFEALLDYDYAGPNPKHDPRGKKGGGGGGSKNP
ncbi:hypothetical protein ABFS83_06G099800 [Erythranthe nasuta]